MFTLLVTLTISAPPQFPTPPQAPAMENPCGDPACDCGCAQTGKCDCASGDHRATTLPVPVSNGFAPVVPTYTVVPQPVIRFQQVSPIRWVPMPQPQPTFRYSVPSPARVPVPRVSVVAGGC